VKGVGKDVIKIIVYIVILVHGYVLMCVN